ncbi:MAG: N-acetylmuramoyl-L-alanine amidase [Gemmatimonadetes bacterium]|nr:N-acetylmuramoyl-L-alanine amidase [Gemmatimonadota bacterium]
MKASAIPTHEADFRTNGKDSDGKKFTLSPFQVTIPDTSETFEVVSCKPASGDESFFYKEASAKKRIVVHYTAGYLKGDIAALTKPNNHVSTPFVVARDGTIYNLFSSRYWSYHLGPGAQGGNSPMSRSGVGIEMSNVGYLKPSGGNLVTYMGANDVYCTADQTEYYTKLAQPFRGYTHYATFTQAQYDSLAKLLRYLSGTYDIPLKFLPEPARYGVYDDVANFRGITTHVNYQPQSYGKWDIGPAFDWQGLISALAKASTVPVTGTTIPAPKPVG